MESLLPAFLNTVPPALLVQTIDVGGIGRQQKESLNLDLPNISSREGLGLVSCMEVQFWIDLGFIAS